MYDFRVAHNMLSGVIRDVCEAIYDELSGEFLKSPANAAEWLEVANGFSNRWNFHHCLGAIDGKHVRIRAPKDTGSVF